MISIVYQYAAHGNKFQEIYHSVKSIQAHFQEPYTLHFVGDLPPGISAHHIPHKRESGVFRTNCLDACRKMELILDSKEISDDFILMYDDLYLLKDVNRSFFDRFYVVNKLLETRPRGNHARLRIETGKALVKNGIEDPFNCETHLPRLYNKDLLREIWEKYQPKENRLLTSSLYFNEFYRDEEPIQLGVNDMIKAEFHGIKNEYSTHSNIYTWIDEYLEDKVILNHNDKGLTPNLIRWIQDRFSLVLS